MGHAVKVRKPVALPVSILALELIQIGAASIYPRRSSRLEAFDCKSSCLKSFGDLYSRGFTGTSGSRLVSQALVNTTAKEGPGREYHGLGAVLLSIQRPDTIDTL